MFKNNLTLICAALLIFYSCKEKSNTLFTSLDNEDTDIKFQNTIFEDGPLNVANYIYFYNGGGVAIGDINNDGLQDILFTGNMVKNRLYLNKGNFKFENITDKSGVADKQGWCTGATMVDINQDGLLDIYICRSADRNPEARKNLLFINNGDLTFSEQADKYGLGETGYSTQAGFFDYDKDGDLDCVVINHSIQKYTAGTQDKVELRNEYNPDFAVKLYRNDQGHYSDVSRESGIISNVFTFGLSLALTDFNNDGWPDISVSNDFNEPDYLFINNRNGTFKEKLSSCIDEASLYSMGSDAADYNNDGLVDYLTLDMLPENNKAIKMHSGAENFEKFQHLFNNGFYFQYSRNMLQRNNGDGTFSEVGQLAGVSNSDWSWSALFGDFDNDGYKDIFISNGYVKDYTEMDFLKYSVDRMIRSMNKENVDPIPTYISKMPRIEISNYIFRNNGNETFAAKTKEWGLDKPGVSAGSAYVDLDNDGDLDLVVNNTNDYASIYRNNSESLIKNNYIRIQLNGSRENKRGIGARVKVYSGELKMYQEQSPVRGFQSSMDPVLNFGIGQNTSIDSIIVIWPTDAFQKFVNVKPNQLLTVNIADAKDKWLFDSIQNKTTLMNQEVLAGVVHKENLYKDFTTQILLPNYLSRQGPCLEVADINGDGLQDFLLGGAKNQPSMIYVQDRNGNFSLKAEPALQKDSTFEDVGAQFFDADGDGDPDLYIASGGYEFNENDPLLQDRLYLNNGHGNFTRNENALPNLFSSESCVKAADFDGDGDLDLFVGGRVVPGKYPLPPHSYLLVNDGKGNFEDATASVCSALQQPGMVTDALWADLNHDKKPDLVVVGEWMPIKVFINNGGKLSDSSSAYIHFGSSGWWNRIYSTDIDGDGDEDLILGNCGLNTQFHVSEKEPLTLHYKDFDENGTIDPIICYYINGVSYPFNALDDLIDQLPMLKKKFLQYSTYSDATINDLFTPEQLQNTTVLKAETMETILLENDGNNGFKKKPLPITAQWSPVYGIATADINQDGKKDILLTGNNTWTRIKFGRYSANHGMVLLADGKGGFTYVPQNESGLNIRGNVRSLKPIQMGNKPSAASFLVGLNDSNALLVEDRK